MTNPQGSATVGAGAPAAPGPAMPGQGIVMTRPRSETWAAAVPWLRGGAFVVAALIALVVAAGSEGFVFHMAMAAFLACTFIVFRHIAHGGRPPRLIPEFVPRTPGSAFALGGLFGVVAVASLVSATKGSDGGGLSIAISIVAVLVIFLLIRQWWDRSDRMRAERRHHH